LWERPFRLEPIGKSEFIRSEIDRKTLNSRFSVNVGFTDKRCEVGIASVDYGGDRAQVKIAIGGVLEFWIEIDKARACDKRSEYVCNVASVLLVP
jgi:hypothetical protein